jgi:hypothetical protein
MPAHGSFRNSSRQLSTPAQLASQVPTCVVRFIFLAIPKLMAGTYALIGPYWQIFVTKYPCDSAAIATVSCTYANLTCHCVHSAEITPLVSSCIQTKSNCTGPELQSMFYPLYYLYRSFGQGTSQQGYFSIQEFGTLVQELCTALNVTAKINTTLPAGSSTTSTSASVATFTGAAPRTGVGTGIFALFVSAVTPPEPRRSRTSCPT